MRLPREPPEASTTPWAELARRNDVRGLVGGMSGADLPPIAERSSLLAVAPPVLVAVDPSIGVASDSSAGGFGTEELTNALVRSQQISTPVHGMRRATSAPHSMDSLASSSEDSGGGSGYLPPSGGPMRRVASSLGMRRSSSFFWTPSAQCAGRTPNLRAMLACSVAPARRAPSARTRERCPTLRYTLPAHNSGGSAAGRHHRTSCTPPPAYHPISDRAPIPAPVTILKRQSRL